MELLFQRDGSTVRFKTTIRVPTHGNIIYAMQLEMGDPHYAGFAADAMQTQFAERVRQIREEAYADGWKDAKSKKKPKEKWFSSRFHP